MDLQEGGSSVLLTGIEGGKGQASMESLAGCLEASEDVTLQDQEPVLQELGEDLEGKVEPSTDDFFQTPVVAGAPFYTLHNVLCNWSDKQCVDILAAQASAMGPESRLLIGTRVMSSELADVFSAAMNILMLTYGGAERTMKQFERLIAAAGLVVEKVWAADERPWVIIEARLSQLKSKL